MSEAHLLKLVPVQDPVEEVKVLPEGLLLEDHVEARPAVAGQPVRQKVGEELAIQGEVGVEQEVHQLEWRRQFTWED